MNGCLPQAPQRWSFFPPLQVTNRKTFFMLVLSWCGPSEEAWCTLRFATYCCHGAWAAKARLWSFVTAVNNFLHAAEWGSAHTWLYSWHIQPFFVFVFFTRDCFDILLLLSRTAHIPGEGLQQPQWRKMGCWLLYSQPFWLRCANIISATTTIKWNTKNASPKTFQRTRSTKCNQANLNKELYGHHAKHKTIIDKGWSYLHKQQRRK